MYKPKFGVSAFFRITAMTIALFLFIGTGSAFAAPIFSAAGPGTVIVTDPDLGDDLSAQFTYDLRGSAGFSTQTWSFLTTATSTGPVTIDFQWTGFHSFFRVRTFLRTVDSGGITTIIMQGPVNCCTSPSNGFNYVGQVTLNTVAGQQYGFVLGGSHFDSARVLRGTLTITRPDDDGDNVANEDDFCPDTSIREGVPTQMLLVNRWALTDDDGIFDTVAPPRGPGPRPDGYRIEDTAGCSCEQILAAQGLELDDGQTMFGCSISVMDDWVELVTP